MPADFDESMRRLVEQLARDVDPSGVLGAVAQRARRRHARRRAQVAALTLAVVIGTAIGAWGLSQVFPAGRQLASPPATTAATPATSTALPQREQTVATIVLGGDLRVVLTASHAAGGRATVWIGADRQVGRAWRRLDQRVVGEQDGWSWTALSASNSVCQLTASDANPTRIGVSLLVRQSGGCSRMYGFRLRDGVLVAN
jgi:hypothetical protein